MGDIIVSPSDVIQAVEASEGNISIFATILNVPRNTAESFIRANPKIAEAMADFHESFLDEAIDLLKDHIRTGNLKALMYFLDRKGGSRGFGNKSSTLIGKIDLNKLSDGQLRRIADGEDVESVVLNPEG